MQLEEATGYALRHGEAVAVDMALTCAIGVELGLLPEPVLHEVLATFDVLGLPTSSSSCTPVAMRAAMLGAVRHRDGRLNLVVPTAIGAATFVADLATVTDGVLRPEHRPGRPHRSGGRRGPRRC